MHKPFVTAIPHARVQRGIALEGCGAIPEVSIVPEAQWNGAGAVIVLNSGVFAIA